MRSLRPAMSLVLLLTLLLGVAYPLLVTAVSRLVFPTQAQGSLLERGSVLVGSTLIGQNFSEARYFWGRPSATLPQPYNGTASGASNLGPLNPALIDQVDASLKKLHAADPGQEAAVPVDLVSASASGLDPHISLAAARYQAARVARSRHTSLDAVNALIDKLASGPLWGVIGESQVNVLELNLALDSPPNE